MSLFGGSSSKKTTNANTSVVTKTNTKLGNVGVTGADAVELVTAIANQQRLQSYYNQRSVEKIVELQMGYFDRLLGNVTVSSPVLSSVPDNVTYTQSNLSKYLLIGGALVGGVILLRRL